MIGIIEFKPDDERVSDFVSVEWPLADLEHYGRKVNFDKRTYRFLAEDSEGSIMGIVEVMIEADLAKVETLLVGHKYRRQGVGRALMYKVLEVAKRESCKKIWLETNAGWEAEKFYKGIGFEVEARLKKHILGQDSLIFVKFL